MFYLYKIGGGLVGSYATLEALIDRKNDFDPGKYMVCEWVSFGLNTEVIASIRMATVTNRLNDRVMCGDQEVIYACDDFRLYTLKIDGVPFCVNPLNLTMLIKAFDERGIVVFMQDQPLRYEAAGNNIVFTDVVTR